MTYQDKVDLMQELSDELAELNKKRAEIKESLRICEDKIQDISRQLGIMIPQAD